MKTTLAVMAAGLGSRYGGIKQIEPMGPHGEILMDYAIYDSVRAGFGKVVFIIKKEMLDDFRDVIGKRIEKKTEVDYAFQTFESLPSFYSMPEGRIKPFGTAHALLCARDAINEPFAIINADDFYGRSAFDTMRARLEEQDPSEKQAAMIGYFLENTVSEHGYVTRGICGVRDGLLTDVTETFRIVVFPDGSIRDVFEDPNGVPLNVRSIVSMNFWGFLPSVFDYAKEYFYGFLKSLRPDDIKSECLLPTMVDHLMRQNGFSVRVLSTDAKWFGVTYKEDKEIVKNKLKILHEHNEYPDLING
jgi:NDP-sugar pyrophosphorylase family protein